MPGGVASVSATSISLSTERSHWTIWSSSPADAKTVESAGCHSREVMGEEWCLKEAAGLPLRGGRRGRKGGEKKSGQESKEGGREKEEGRRILQGGIERVAERWIERK